MVVRGVPHRIAKDGWWLDDADPPKGIRPSIVLILVLLAADLLIWGFRPGLGIAVWMILAGAAVALTVYGSISRRPLLIASCILILAIAPLIEVVQPGTVLIALLGLFAFGVIVARNRLESGVLLQSILRLPVYGIARNVQDILAVRVPSPRSGGLRGAVLDWALSLGLGGLFILLFAAANPVLDQWIAGLAAFPYDFTPDPDRVYFWCLIAWSIWPLLRLKQMMPQLAQSKPARGAALRSGFVNMRSVRRALIVFNLIFAVQTVLDAGYLWGGVALPDGMSYATYAHRGAYPLLATAILAGVFALISQPYLGRRFDVRLLLYVWVGQTVALVISSVLRLDLYVDVYGLTRLRFSAFVWMTVVALGLVLIIMQMAGRHTIRWFLERAFGLAIMSIYLCNLVNIDGLIARHNLADPRPGDVYICELGEGAVPAIRAYELRTGRVVCHSRQPYLSARGDWREWGYRNARLHLSLAALEEQQ